MEELIKFAGDLFSRLTPAALADIFIVGLLIYGLLSLLQGTRAEIVLRGAIIFILVLFIIVSIFNLPVLRWLVANSVPALLVGIPVIFQQEIRRALEQIGHSSHLLNRSLNLRRPNVQKQTIEAIVNSSVFLSNQRWGGLMIIERETGLQDVMESSSSSVLIEGLVTTQLLENIFVPNTPLHDGAVIIREDKVVAAAVTLPLTDNPTLPQHFGTRHRAALGITEVSDAVAVVVSEETGSLSLAASGKLFPRLNREELTRHLEEELLLEGLPRARRFFQNNKGKEAAVIYGKDNKEFYKVHIKNNQVKLNQPPNKEPTDLKSKKSS